MGATNMETQMDAGEDEGIELDPLTYAMLATYEAYADRDWRRLKREMEKTKRRIWREEDKANGS